MSKLTTIKKVANGGFQAELQDVVEKPGRTNVLAKLNKGDARFQVGTQRRAWFPVTIQSLEELGVSAISIAKIQLLEEGGIVEVMLDSPKIEGEELRIQVIESIYPDTYQKENVKSTAKQIMISDDIAKTNNINTDYNLSQYKNKLGYFLDEAGNFIFSKTTVSIASQVKHTFIPAKLVPETELADFGAVLATSTGESVEA